MVTRSGTCGVVCVFKRQDFEVIPGAFLIRFRLGPDANPEYIRLAMMNPDVQVRIQAMAAGGVQKNLSSTNLAKLLLPLPSSREQADVVFACSVIGDRIRAERANLCTLRSSKVALQSALLTGEIRVTADEAAP
ncbi:hypothetical protein WMF27_30235 [Sorangium sp. So ce281]|uniref:restriction endonuclease subunit S n=1 Tax=unclassified Sorangium TaxID=2621164 RepID=UPI003F5D7D8E